MIEAEGKTNHVEDQKIKIRERYKGVDPDSLDVIPAKPKVDVYQTEEEQRVAVYARVSTDDPRQTSSYELQKNYYEDLVQQRPNWVLVDIYADEGISGTSLKHRDAFIRMIEDCKRGKIDLIITKNVSRFARNIVDCIGYVRQLAALKPPVGVIFETERIYTLDSKSEMSLSFIATLAQEESHNKSESMNKSVEMRFKHGIFLTPVLLGYDKDEYGNLIINEEEATTVRNIYFMCIFGYSTSEIAQKLNELEKQTKRGNTNWSIGSILHILTNERYCGDVLARKTFTPNFLDHKSKKNNKDRNQYYQRDHHEPIISRDDFIAVQQILRNAKYGNKDGFLPHLTIIDEGLLHGYISINPRWAGFTPDDYITALQSIPTNVKSSSIETYEVKEGSFDLRGYEIARGQFFASPHRISVSIWIDKLIFSSEAIHKLNNVFFIEILIHPEKKVMAIRPAKKENRNHMQWARNHKQSIVPRMISGKAFLPTLFDLLGWDGKWKYKITGSFLQKENECLLSFNTDEAEVIIPVEKTNQAQSADSKNKIHAFPLDWKDDFGPGYYERMAEEKKKQDIQKWKITSAGIPFKNQTLNVTPKSEIERILQSIIPQEESGHE